MTIVDVQWTFTETIITVDSQQHADSLIQDNPGSILKRTIKGLWEVTIPLPISPND